MRKQRPGKHAFNPVPITGQVFLHPEHGWVRITRVRFTDANWTRLVDTVSLDYGHTATFTVSY